MDVGRVNPERVICHTPPMKCTDGHGRNGQVRRAVFSTIYVESFLILGKVNNSIRGGILNPGYQFRRRERLGKRRQLTFRSYCNRGTNLASCADGRAISKLLPKDGREIPCLCIL
jgi:hypothetical protein